MLASGCVPAVEELIDIMLVYFLAMEALEAPGITGVFPSYRVYTKDCGTPFKFQAAKCWQHCLHVTRDCQLDSFGKSARSNLSDLS